MMNPPLHESVSRDQVATVVHRFYEKVLADPLLAPHFTEITDWQRHEGYIVDFWWGVMGGRVESPRPGAMLTSHQGLGINEAEMAQWLALFTESINEYLPPAEAAQWQAMARGIATMMGAHGLVSDSARNHHHGEGPTRN